MPVQRQNQVATAQPRSDPDPLDRAVQNQRAAPWKVGRCLDRPCQLILAAGRNRSASKPGAREMIESMRSTQFGPPARCELPGQLIPVRPDRHPWCSRTRPWIWDAQLPAPPMAGAVALRLHADAVRVRVSAAYRAWRAVSISRALARGIARTPPCPGTSLLSA